MSNWSVTKLNQFYATEIGMHIKKVIHKDIQNVFQKYFEIENTNPSVITCGYDIMEGKYENTLSPQSMQDMYDGIIAYHCDELSFCMKEFSSFAFDHLKEKGICIVVVSNGWNDRSVPFCKHRSYKMLKALKRLNFKILSKKPLLAYPTKIINTFLEGTYPIWNFMCKYIYPSNAGACLIVAQKHTCPIAPKFPKLHKMMEKVDINKAYRDSKPFNS